ncbi:MAG: hypothetical protein JWM16_3045 [Verrucomicrobiales bacterium]|nr:hypothetical protein [Verrucomicrobiales bacterium]
MSIQSLFFLGKNVILNVPKIRGRLLLFSGKFLEHQASFAPIPTISLQQEH